MPQTIIILIIVLTGLVSASAQCTTIRVVGPAGITNPGDDITFRADVKVFDPKLTYSWSTDKGTIIKGQGTPEMTLTTIGLTGDVVTATVDVGGLPDGCERNASETAGIAERIGCILHDEWTEMKPNDVRGHLDLFFVDLINRPTDRGVVHLFVPPGERLDRKNPRIRFVLNHVKFRGFDKNRLWFALESAKERRTRLVRMVSEEEVPCEKCVVIKGEQL